MPSKQGGKGKTSSPSDQGYWKRVSGEKQRAKRIEKHARRLIRQGMFANTPNALKAAINYCEPTGKISYGHRAHKFEPPRVVLTTMHKDIRSEHYPLDQVISEGVILESSARESDALACISMLGTFVSYQHIRQFPSGRRVLIASRNCN